MVILALAHAKPRFPIWAVSKLKGQSKRDDGMIFGSCKASQTPRVPYHTVGLIDLDRAAKPLLVLLVDAAEWATVATRVRGGLAATAAGFVEERDRGG